MDIISFTLNALIVIGLAGLIGFEREYRGKVAGIRTHMIVALAAYLFTVTALSYFDKQDAARIIANILVGMGFIGAGVIIKEENRVIGVTTAATLWFSAAIGAAIGLGFVEFSIISTLIVLILLLIKSLERKLIHGS